MDHAFDNDQAITRDSLYGTRAEPTYAGITSFMRRRYTRDLHGVDLVVSGVPFDTATTNRPGSRFGPRAIRAASIQSAWARHFPWAFDPFDLLACIDYGDCHFDHGTPQDTPAAIEAHADRILAAGCAMLTLGGDHFISYPLLKAHAKQHGPLALITSTRTATPGRTRRARASTTAPCSTTPPARAWSTRRARCRSACAPPTMT